MKSWFAASVSFALTIIQFAHSGHPDAALILRLVGEIYLLAMVNRAARPRALGAAAVPES